MPALCFPDSDPAPAPAYAPEFSHAAPLFNGNAGDGVPQPMRNKQRGYSGVLDQRTATALAGEAASGEGAAVFAEGRGESGSGLIVLLALGALAVALTRNN